MKSLLKTPAKSKKDLLAAKQKALAKRASKGSKKELTAALVPEGSEESRQAIIQRLVDRGMDRQLAERMIG
jgi:hypothetical protein